MLHAYIKRLIFILRKIKIIELILNLYLPYVIVLSYVAISIAYKLVVELNIIVTMLQLYLVDALMVLAIFYILSHYIFKYRFWSLRKAVEPFLLNLTVIIMFVTGILIFNLVSIEESGLSRAILIGCRNSAQALQRLVTVLILILVVAFNVATLFVDSRRIMFIVKLLGAFALILLAASLLYINIAVEFEYTYTLTEFREYYVKCMSNSSNALACMWSLTLKYESEFIATYRAPCAKPRQLLLRIPPLADTRDLVAKLAATAKTDACLDFGIGVTKILSDLGFETRVVSFLGWDHAIPEVKINGTWFVIDAMYTTPNNPVPAPMYGDYLKAYHSDIYASLKGLLDFDTGLDVSGEHGFSLSG